jgi:hypothetical protein
MLRQISLPPARAVGAPKRQGLEPFYNIGFTPWCTYMSSIMRRRRGVMEKLLCEMFFVADNIPFSSQRHSAGRRLRFD